MNPSLYLVTAPQADRAALVDLVDRAVTGGVTAVQLRDKSATTDQRRETALALRDAVRPRGVPVLVDDDLDAAAAVDGVHVGPGDAHPAVARQALGPEALVGWSLESLAQLDDGAALAACDYLAVSPVWATPTKPDHARPWGLEGLRTVVATVAGRLPVVGIGGIDAGRAGQVVATGAAGVCVVSAICDVPDPGAAARDLCRALAAEPR